MESFDLMSLRTVLVGEIHGKALYDEDPPLQDLLHVTNDTNLQREYRLMLGFRDRKKVDEIP